MSLQAQVFQAFITHNTTEMHTVKGDLGGICLTVCNKNVSTISVYIVFIIKQLCKKVGSHGLLVPTPMLVSVLDWCSSNSVHIYVNFRVVTATKQLVPSRVTEKLGSLIRWLLGLAQCLATTTN